jgi:hypothetical protein
MNIEYIMNIEEMWKSRKKNNDNKINQEIYINVKVPHTSWHIVKLKYIKTCRHWLNFKTTWNTKVLLLQNCKYTCICIQNRHNSWKKYASKLGQISGRIIQYI